MSDEVRRALALQQWEIAKGHIRASVALRGATRLWGGPKTFRDEVVQTALFKEFESCAEGFIARVEDEGWHE